ncbi:MAG TPA: hypothetical protein VMS12_07095 [Thermoanaerobaculia bacterium]|nr:hypothetical protein [Thermoanaerobaculia bacterium]
MQLISIAAALLLLGAFGFFGLVLLARYCGSALEPLEIWAFGPPIGIVAGSLALLSAACVVGLHPWLTIAVALVCVAGGVFALRTHPFEKRTPEEEKKKGKGTHARQSQPATPESRSRQTRLGLPSISASFGWIPALILSAFAVRWALFWWSGYSEDAAGLWAGNTGFWADWALHMGDVASFALGDNFPPQDPRYAGSPHSYHYLTSITAAAMVQLGLDITTALTLQSFVLSLLILLGIYAFARRISGDRTVGALTVVLFLLGGTLGWVLTVSEMNAQHSVLGVLKGSAWDAVRQEAANFRFQNIFFSLIQPQRSFLYGIPLGLLVMTLLFEGVETRRRLVFITAGVVAGLLPFANLSTLLSLAILTPFLFLLFPSRAWIWFFLMWAVIGLPQVLLQQGGSAGAASAIRLQVGWLAAPDSWVWFWLKNLGLFLPLLVIAMFRRDLMNEKSRRFLFAFTALFIAANLFVFQPWDWDNTKILIFWFLSASICVAALMVDTWRRFPSATVRFLISLVVMTMIGSGLLANLNQLLGRERQLVLTSEELEFAARVEAQTEPRSLIAVGIQHNHPVPMLSGRPVLMSYPGWLWSHGRDYRQRELDLQSIYRMGPDAGRKLEEYGIDYIVVGPSEMSQLGADRGAFRQRFRSVISTANYELFALR